MNPNIRGATSDYDALFHARSYLGELPPPYRSSSFAKLGSDRAILPPLTSFGPDELKRYLHDVFMPEEQPATLGDDECDALVKLLKDMTAKKALGSPFFQEKGECRRIRG